MAESHGARERSVGFDDDVVGGAEGCDVGAGVEGVDFDLVDGGFDARIGGEEFLKLFAMRYMSAAVILPTTTPSTILLME